MPFCEAIRTRQLLLFWYHGHRHLVEPYAFGKDQDHDLALLAYQISGRHNANAISEWQLYKRVEMKNVAIAPIEFSLGRPGYHRNDPRFVEIDCQL